MQAAEIIVAIREELSRPRPRLLALSGIVVFVALFIVPWLFISPPHGPRFYELVAQVFPVLVLAWVIELRGTVWRDVAAEPGLAALAPWADGVLSVVGEGTALYAAGYGVSNRVTFALTAGPLAFFGPRIFVRATKQKARP